MTQDTVTLRNMPASPREFSPWTMEEMVNDTLALKALLMRETQALKAMDILTVKLLHDDKLRLIRKLELQKELLARDISLLQGVNEVQKKRLKSASDGMDSVMKENFYEVLKAREVNQCVVRAISGAVRKHEQQAVGYNRRGITSTQTSAYAGHESAPSVALNQMI